MANKPTGSFIVMSYADKARDEKRDTQRDRKHSFAAARDAANALHDAGKGDFYVVETKVVYTTRARTI